MAGAMEMPSLGIRMYDLTDQHIEAALTNLIAGLESEYKFEVNPVLIKVILGGAMSVDEVQDSALLGLELGCCVQPSGGHRILKMMYPHVPC
uniref:Uncharacterized protein n=1 Tax=Oryza rufipogon TaxID=4529 RepID=A0A0E0QWI0_ORYRU